MTKSKFEAEKEKWIKRGEIKTYNMTELLTYDEKQTEDHLAGAEVCAYAAYTSRLHVMLYTVRTVWSILPNGDTGDVMRENYKLFLHFKESNGCGKTGNVAVFFCVNKDLARKGYFW